MHSVTRNAHILMQERIIENLTSPAARIPYAGINASVQTIGFTTVIHPTMRLPQGYDTLLGAGGYQLSGGQRQRIGLARAVYNNPAFIVLDEPNANLDDAGEFALVKAINTLRTQGQTTVIISHRPTLLGVVNKVLLLNDGAIQEFGTRDQVFAHLRQANVLKPVATPSPSTTEQQREA